MHSRFRIPIEIDKDSCCGIDANSDLAELIEMSELMALMMMMTMQNPRCKVVAIS